MEILTDVDLALWLRLQSPEVVELFVHVCAQQAREQDEASAHEIFTATGRAVLEGRNPVELQRKLAPMIEDYYETERV